VKKSEKIKALATLETLLDSSPEMATALVTILTFAAQTEESVVVQARAPAGKKTTPKITGRGKAQADDDLDEDLDDLEVEDEEEDESELDEDLDEDLDGEEDELDEEEEEEVKPRRKPSRATKPAKPAPKPSRASAKSAVEYVKRLNAGSIRMGWKRASKEGISKKYENAGGTELKGSFTAIGLEMSNHYGEAGTRAEKIATAALSLSAIETVTAYIVANFEKAEILTAFDKIVADDRPKNIKIAIAMMVDEALAKG
jgi:hypothetical protein